MLTSKMLKAALDLTSVPMLAATGEGRVALLNAEFEDLIGYTTDELKGQPIERLLPRAIRDKHADYVRAFTKVPAKRKMGSGKPLIGLAKSGEEIPLEIGLNSVDVDGELHCIVVAVDLRIRMSHQRKMELAMEAAAAAMVMVDEEGKIVLTNEAALELSGYSRKELLLKSVERLIAGPSRVHHEVFRKNYRHNESRESLKHPRRIHMRHKDGRRIPVEIALTPVSTPEGEMVMSTITDLTQRVAAERETAKKNAELAEANRKLGEANGELMQFAYSVSHDLKAPLASLLGLLNLIDEDLEEENAVSARATVKRAAAICERSRTKVERVLKFAHDADDEKPVAIKLPKLVDEVWEAISPGATIETDLVRTFDIDTVVAKPTGVEIMLQNLLDNAVKYHDPRKKTARIKVQSKAAEGGVEITVSDEGVGISKTHHQAIFDLFRRADPRSGDGIGLAMVKKQVTRLGGRVSLDSKVGEGTSVRIFLPQDRGEEGKPCAYQS